MVVLRLLLRANRSVTGAFVDYGQAALPQEMVASQRVAAHFGIDLIKLQLEFPRRYGAGEIRHRNGTLIFAAAMATGEFADSIALGVHAGIPYADCSANFLESVEGALRQSHSSSMLLVAPLKTWSKSEIIAYAKQEHLPLELTYSCEAGGVPPCGRCASCVDRADL
jgi:7-cyano-7-deazaguanine synthase